IKMIGVVVVSGIFYALNAFVGLEFLETRATAFNIAVVHTLFNIVSTIILLPFCSLFEKLALKTIKSKKEEEEADVFAVLDERFLAMPSFAVEKAKDLVCEMAMISNKSFRIATELMDNFDDEAFENVKKLESRVDKYEDKISTYLVKIAENQVAAVESRVVTELLHCIGDIERISDHALNIAEVAEEIHEKKIDFSEKAKADIRIITNAVSEVLEIAIASLVDDDLDAARRVEPLEQVIDRLKRKIKSGHITRLRQGDCTMELGFILSDLLTNYERIADHCSNIAVCFIEMSHDSFETHEYLNNIKAGGDDTEFKEMYQEYKAKYYME
ncbi:MAG: Na/Pi cotransporter family protein, partial [Clostridia bacterium]|nr:Na/Pi cotransporter family protein [Clostridia bacterium]